MKVKLSDVCVKGGIQTGPFGAQLHQSDYSDQGTPVCMPVNLVDGSISENGIARVTDEHVERLSRYKVKAGDLLYARRGDVGRGSLVGEYEDGWLCGTGCLKVTPDPNKIDSRYLFYLTSLPESVGWLVNHAKGTTMLNLNTGILSSLPLDIENDLEKQRRIADVLSAYDELIENNRRQIKLLEEAAQRLYKEWFVDLKFPGHETTPIHNGLPEGWKKAKLIDVADVQYGFAFKSSLFNTSGMGLPIIRIRNVKDGYSADFTTELADKRYLVNDGETVVGMDGDFYINSWSGGLAYLVQRSCRIKSRDAVHDAYLRWALVDPLRQFQNGIVGATVAHLGKRHIDSIDVLIPPVEYLKSFTACRDSIVNCRRSIRAAREARDRLLPKLMSGEIEV